MKAPDHDTSMQDLRPTVWIGKQGCTETLLQEIREQLARRKIIKVKWLQNAEVDRKRSPGVPAPTWSG
jgi:RNA-binding protein